MVELGSTLDKVGHGAGQSCVRIVPAEHLPDLREVCDIMFSWIRPVAVLTSHLFLPDEKGEMDMPSHINGGRPSRPSRPSCRPMGLGTYNRIYKMVLHDAGHSEVGRQQWPM